MLTLCVHYAPVWVSRVVSFILIRQAVARPRPRLAIHYFG